MSLVIAQIINGLQTGSIFALVALGYSMVYGIILLLNFAHGDIIMVGAYMTFYAITTFHLHPLLSVVLAVVVSTLLGVVIEKVAYTPLRSAPRLSLLITAIGISFLLENGAQLIFGADSKSMDPMVTGNLSVGGISISYAALITILVSVAAMLLLTFLVQGTKLGKAMRAVSEDMGAAQLMGININKTISFTFAVGSALAGIGSVLKHFPGYGSNRDTHTGIAVDQRPLEQFRQSDFLPFQAGIDAGAGGVLVSHNIVTCLDPELPASLSPASYQVLREELGFEGVAMTDDLDMDAVQKYVEEGTAPVMALQAGADLVLTSDPQGGIPSVLEAVETGALTWDRLDQSVLRVLRWKLQLGLLSLPGAEDVQTS